VPEVCKDRESFAGLRITETPKVQSDPPGAGVLSRLVRVNVATHLTRQAHTTA
jgi:hypothetical protein